MKVRLSAAGLILALCISLSACTGGAPSQALLRGEKTEYSQTIAYANRAWGGVGMTESDGTHTLKNLTAQMEFAEDTAGLHSMISLQTGECILQKTAVTYLTKPDGTVGRIFGGTETTTRGNYGVSHCRTDSDVRFRSGAEQSEVLKEYDLTGAEAQETFSILKNDVIPEGTSEGLKIISSGKSRSQFGARYLGLDLGEDQRFYLSVTLKATDVSGLKCYFSTDEASLTEDTLLGTLDLTTARGDTFVTLTAEIENEFWSGVLQTLLFRLPEGESGTVEISRIAILTANDPVDEGVASALWTIYSDRIYFTQTLTQGSYREATTIFSVHGGKCTDVIETEDFIGLKLIDGSVLGFVRPLNGGTLKLERTDAEVRVILTWDLSVEQPEVTLRIYLNYTDTTEELDRIASEERNPLSAEYFSLQGAEFQGYDPKGGIYRLKRTEDQVTISVKKNDRTVYVYLDPAENFAWSLCDRKGNLLPVFTGTTFPLCATEKKLTVQLNSKPATQALEIPPFFDSLGLLKQSDSATVLHGLCAQNTVEYLAPDGSYSLTLTATRLNGGTATVYDVEYTFRKPVFVESLRESFPAFSFELDYGFDEYFYLNGEGQPVSAAAGNEEFSYLGAMPYVGLSADEASAGWLITEGHLTATGIRSTALMCLRYEEVSQDSPNKLYLSFDWEKASFVTGDTLTARIIHSEGNISPDSLKNLRSNGSFRLIQTVQKSEKTVTAIGMEDTVLMRMEGFDRYVFPEITANGEPFSPEYCVYVDENGYYGFAFSVATGTEIKVTD